MFTYCIMNNLPLPPQWLIDEIDLDYRPTDQDVDYGTPTGYNIDISVQRHLRNWGDTNPKAVRNKRIPNLKFDSWARENIYKNINDVGINYSIVESGAGKCSTGAHTDGTRNYVLLFPITQGGPDAKLHFWKEKDHEVIRPRKTQGEDFDRLILLDKIQLPENCWTLAHTTILHSVEDLFSTRINLQISLNDNPWQQ